MPTELDAQFIGLDAAIAELRLMPREVERALRTAENKTGARVRTIIRGSLRSGLDLTTARVRRRLFGQKGRAWIGANPVPAQWVSGLVTEDASGAVLVAGIPEPGAFVLNVPGRPIMRRTESGRLERVGVDILRAAGVALDRAEREAPEEFERQFRLAAEALVSR